MSDTARSPGADIGKQQIAAIYAKALLAVTEKSGVTESLLEEFDTLVTDVLDRFPRLEATLNSPRVSAEEKSNLLDRLFAHRMSANLLTFLKIVGQHGRLDCLRQIRRAARHQCNQLRGRVEVHVTTAHPLPSELHQRISDELSAHLGNEIALEADVVESLIGGLVVRVGDTVYDGSVLNKLNQMRSQAIHQACQQMREQAERFAAAK
jgi:F-type H+-transporting ATPase subunit delta